MSNCNKALESVLNILCEIWIIRGSRDDVCVDETIHIW